VQRLAQALRDRAEVWWELVWSPGRAVVVFLFAIIRPLRDLWPDTMKIVRDFITGYWLIGGLLLIVGILLEGSYRVISGLKVRIQGLENQIALTVELFHDEECLKCRSITSDLTALSVGVRNSGKTTSVTAVATFYPHDDPWAYPDLNISRLHRSEWSLSPGTVLLPQTTLRHEHFELVRYERSGLSICTVDGPRKITKRKYTVRVVCAGTESRETVAWFWITYTGGLTGITFGQPHLSQFWR
jgi:hypothetical protein